MSNSNIPDNSQEPVNVQSDIAENVMEKSGSQRKIRILQPLKSKGIELTKVSEDIQSLSKNQTKKDLIRSRVEKFENEQTAAKASVANKENVDGNIVISRNADMLKKGNAIKISFKSEYEEMVDNHKYVKKVLEYQANFRNLIKKVLYLKR